MKKPPSTSHRTLRRKSDRARLWYAADGHCQRCGGPLGDDWEADHTIPWFLTHTTNVHEMQALCAPCNREKSNTVHGIKVDKLRKFQRELVLIAEEIAARRPIHTILANVTPGGGKSFLPVILQHIMNPNAYIEGFKNGGIEYYVVWVVPRDSLREQAEREVYPDRFFRGMVPHELAIRASGNDSNPSRDAAGCITTYQSIAADPGNWLAEFSRPNRKIILVLDEFHHVELEGRTHQALKPLWDRAAIRLLMTGTMERGDNRRIAFLPYRQISQNKYVPDVEDADGWRYIRYTRAQAKADHAILPVEFRPQDAKLEYIDRYGDHRIVVGFDQSKDDAADALYVALNTEYAMQVCARCADDWEEWREINPNAKLLVVVSTQKQARELTAYLKVRFGRRVNIAISDDTEGARANIKAFKVPHNGQAERLDILVTVGMAYEGMDVKGISHIALLTRIRSKPWLEQCIARAVRVDKKGDCGLDYDVQIARVFAPDDLLFREVMALIQREQGEPARDLTKRQPDADRDGLVEDDVFGDGEPGSATPLAGVVIGDRIFDLEGNEMPGNALDYYGAIAKQAGIPQAYVFQLRNAIEITKRQELEQETRIEDYLATEGVDDTPITTPSQRERELRRGITRKMGRWDHEAGHEPGEGNKIALRKFGKPRADMSETELLLVLRWVNERLSGYVDGADDDDA